MRREGAAHRAVRAVQQYYEQHHRRQLPWRHTRSAQLHCQHTTGKYYSSLPDYIICLRLYTVAAAVSTARAATAGTTGLEL